MEKLDLFKGMTLSDEEIFVIHGGISITEEGGNLCGGSCNGGDGGACSRCVWDHVAKSYLSMVENGLRAFVL